MIWGFPKLGLYGVPRVRIRRIWVLVPRCRETSISFLLLHGTAAQTKFCYRGESYCPFCPRQDPSGLCGRLGWCRVLACGYYGTPSISAMSTAPARAEHSKLLRHKYGPTAACPYFVSQWNFNTSAAKAGSMSHVVLFCKR